MFFWVTNDALQPPTATLPGVLKVRWRLIILLRVGIYSQIFLKASGIEETTNLGLLAVPASEGWDVLLALFYLLSVSVVCPVYVVKCLQFCVTGRSPSGSEHAPILNMADNPTPNWVSPSSSSTRCINPWIFDWTFHCSVFPRGSGRCWAFFVFHSFRLTFPFGNFSLNTS